MRLLLRIWAVLIVTVKRLFSQAGLALGALLGLVIVIALTLSIPIYADAVYQRIFTQELAQLTTNSSSRTRPPFVFMLRYIGSWHGPVEWEDIQPLDTYLSASASAALGLPQDLLVRYVKTDNFRLFPQADVAYSDSKDPLVWASFGFISDFENQIVLVEGDFPAVAAGPDSAVEVLLHETLALKLGLQVGETYVMFGQRNVNGIKQKIQIPVRIAGIWQPKDVASLFWFYLPDSFAEVLLLPEESFQQRLAPYMDGEVYLILWYVVLDGSQVRADNAGRLLVRINALQQQASALLPNTKLDISPKEALVKYQQAASILTILLYAFSIPILVLTLTFIGLVVSLLVGQRRNEVAVLRSRGATVMQIIGIAALEGLLLGLVGFVIALPVSQMIAQLISQTRSFLNFSTQADLQLTITPATLRFGLIAIGLTLIAQVIPTIGAARHTIVTYKQERARALRPPWWQRVWLDILLLIPAIYGAYLLQQQGSIVVLGINATPSSNDPFQNPLLLLVPALLIFALTLFFLRLLPLFMTFLAWLAAHFGGVGFLLATRQLARMPGFYTAPMILLVLTLSLSAFTASLAQTLDYHLFDQQYYKNGADLVFTEFGQSTQPSFLTGLAGGDEQTSSDVEETPGPRWDFLPAIEYLKAPDVQAVSRVGRYEATTKLSGATQKVIFMGVDRVDFSQVAFWRGDFAPSSLGELMNALALTSNGVLLPQNFMRQHALHVGDTIQASTLLYGQRATLDLKVMGGFDLFPSWYPEDGPLLVGNLDYLYDQAGGQVPYHVWLKTKPGVAGVQAIAEIRQVNSQVINATDTLDEIALAQEGPERQGLFGILSVGFGAAAILTILGFLLYGFFSFRQRFIELGVLRAVGLSSFQMIIFLGWELAFLILTGLILGTALGAWVSQLFIPFLQIGNDSVALVPPFLVEIAWPAIFRIYLLFGLLFVVALAVLVILLLRIKIFRAIKLGETV